METVACPECDLLQHLSELPLLSETGRPMNSSPFQGWGISSCLQMARTVPSFLSASRRFAFASSSSCAQIITPGWPRKLRTKGATIMKPLRFLTLAMLAALTLVVNAHAADPLPSWSDGPAKQALVDFVRATTDKASPKFVPPEVLTDCSHLFTTLAVAASVPLCHALVVRCSVAKGNLGVSPWLI